MLDAMDAFLVIEVNLAMIGVLPRVFFCRGGRLNFRWWLTAAPFFVCGVAQVAHVAGWVDALGFGAAAPVLRGTGVVMSAGSIALIWYTVGTHRIPLALWHQDDDAPHEIVTWGPYRRVRHPFYAAFLLALVAGALITPHVATFGAALYGFGALDLTARREERRLRAGSLGVEYTAYIRGTGRFAPGLGRAS
jgi:isoprenylcysteine carboxyl methyltransferase (ICMT) family protein